jgi:hypothetical protein
MVSNDISDKNLDNLDQPMSDDQESNTSSELDFDENKNMSSIIHSIYPINKSRC